MGVVDLGCFPEWRGRKEGNMEKDACNMSNVE